MAIKSINELQEQRPCIDLTGPDGNAFFLMARAQSFADQLGMDFAPIEADMQNGNYEHLIEVFERHFGDYVDLYR